MGKNFTGRRKLGMEKNANNKLLFLFLFSKETQRERDLTKIGKCFPFDKERKTLSCDKRQIFSLTGKNFPLTNFPDGCQT